MPTLLLRFNIEKGHFYVINKLLLKLFAAKNILSNNHMFRAWKINAILLALLKNKTAFLKGENHFLWAHVCGHKTKAYTSKQVHLTRQFKSTHTFWTFLQPRFNVLGSSPPLPLLFFRVGVRFGVRRGLVAFLLVVHGRDGVRLKTE